MDHSPESQVVLFGAAAHPGCDSPREDALDGGGVEVPEHPFGELKVSQTSEVVETLTGLLHKGVGVA